MPNTEQLKQQARELRLCKDHKQEWKQSEYAKENCDYCSLLAEVEHCNEREVGYDIKIANLEAEVERLEKQLKGELK